MRLYFECVALTLLIGVMGGPLVYAQSTEGHVEGQITSTEEGAPLERVNVVLREGDSTHGTSTGPEGQFRVSVPPGHYQLEATALGYEGLRETVTVTAGDTTRLSLSLRPQEYTLNEIVVSDRRGDQGRSTSTVQRVEPSAIDQQDPSDVSELARLVPATHAQTNSRGQTILYFRNAGDRQVGQFFDGALLNVPWDNRVDISLVPASVIEEVTVAKGIPSVRYGANVLGGAVNFQSRTLDEPGNEAEISGQVGTAAQRQGSVTYLGRTQKWDYTTALQYTGQGDQPLPSGVRLPDESSTDRRVNTDREFLTGFGRASYRFDNGGQLGVSVLHVGAEQGVAPESHLPQDQTRYWRYPLWQKSKFIVSGQTPIGGETSLQGAIWASRFAQDINQYRSVSYADLKEQQQDRDLTSGLRLIATQGLSPGTLTLTFNGLTTRHHQTNHLFEETGAGTDSISVYRQHLFSVGTEYETSVTPRIDFTLGGNLDGSVMPETGPFPDRDPFYAWGVVSGVQVDLRGSWEGRLSAGRKTRFPTMRELFGAALGKFVPNPDLSPVSAWIGEAELQYQRPQWSWGATAFLNRVYDTIGKRTFQSGPNEGREQRINLLGARVYGLETRGRWMPAERVTLDGHVTWSRPRSFTEQGTQKLDEKPAWLGMGTMTYDHPVGLSVMGQFTYTGGTYARNQRNEFERLPSSLIADARVSYRLPSLVDIEEGEVFVRIDNLTDEARFLQLGLPGPGRSLRAGIELTL